MSNKDRRMAISEPSKRTSIGVIVDAELKNKILKIAKDQKRSLSSQVEFFLHQSVEHWETSSTNKSQETSHD